MLSRAISNVNECLKLHAMALDQYLTCQKGPVQLTHFSVKTSHIAQWVHIFSMSLGDFSTSILIFKCVPSGNSLDMQWGLSINAFRP